MLFMQLQTRCSKHREMSKNDRVLKNIALTAGASAPEILINNVVNFFKEKFLTNVHEVNFTNENIIFHPPKILRDLKKAANACI